jgi:hypothetical protein
MKKPSPVIASHGDSYQMSWGQKRKKKKRERNKGADQNTVGKRQQEVMKQGVKPQILFRFCELTGQSM